MKAINTKGAAKTGDQPTLTVAIEQNFPEEQRIINDKLAPKLYGGGNGFWIKITKNSVIRRWVVNLGEKFAPGAWSLFLVRKRYIDERFIEAIEKNKIKYAVNLGAGFDTRFYRFSEAQNMMAWEVDQAENIDSKKKAVEKALGAFPKHVKQVSINFINQNIEEVLKNQGFTGRDKTFFIWEAVSQYLDEAAFQKTFAFLSKASSGSQLVFTYVLKDFIDGENLYGQEFMYKKAVKQNLWHLGLETRCIPELLKKYGWQIKNDVGCAELDEAYVKPTGRKLGVMEIERIVFAEKV